MKIRILVYAAVIAAAAFGLGSATTAFAKKKTMVTPEPFPCWDYAPVCGSKGGLRFTYANACSARRDGAKLVSHRACAVTKAHKARRHHHKAKKPMYKPAKPAAKKSEATPMPKSEMKPAPKAASAPAQPMQAKPAPAASSPPPMQKSEAKPAEKAPMAPAPAAENKPAPMAAPAQSTPATPDDKPSK